MLSLRRILYIGDSYVCPSCRLWAIKKELAHFRCCMLTDMLLRFLNFEMSLIVIGNSISARFNTILRLFFIANLSLNTMFTFTLPCLSTVSRTRTSTTSPASFENRCGSMWLEFITVPVNIRFSNVVSISRHRSLYPTSICTNHSHTESFKFSSLTIHMITECLLPIDNHRHLAWLCSFRDFMNSSHVTYSSAVFSWVAFSIKSRSMLWLALTNDASKSSHFIPFIFISFTWSRDICITLHWWWYHRSTCCDMSYHIECL